MLIYLLNFTSILKVIQKINNNNNGLGRSKGGCFVCRRSIRGGAQWPKKLFF